MNFTVNEERRYPRPGKEGSCGVWPLQCYCGEILYEDSVAGECGDPDCDICEYCTDTTCPKCGKHICCGGCI